MKRRLSCVALAVLLACLSCTGSRSMPPAPASTPSASAAARVTPSTSSPALPTLVLQASLSEPEASWTRVLFVPFGEGRKRLRYTPLNESLPLEPHSFTIGPDGSVWILDNANSRVAHFSLAGTFLEGIQNVPAIAADLAFVGTDLYVVLDPRGRMARVDADKSLHEFTVRDSNRSLYLAELVGSDGTLVARVAGYADAPGTGPVGFAELALSGQARIELLQGLRIGGQSFIRMESVDTPEVGDQDFHAVYVMPELTQVQPLHVDVLADGGSGPEPIPAEVGPGGLVPMGSSAAMYVMIAPSRPGDAARFGGARWLLRIGPGPDPLLWERLPDPGVPDERQTRHLAVGPDGSLYLMVMQKDGVQIYRRP